jgi:putative glycerol-1-phosphate prenyltransferase
MKHTLYNKIQERKSAGKKSFAVLIDPDKVNVATTEQLVSLA